MRSYKNNGDVCRDTNSQTKSVDPDQTAPRTVVWSRYALCAIMLAGFKISKIINKGQFQHKE